MALPKKYYFVVKLSPMKTMIILGWFFLIGLAWAADEKFEFILPQQIRSTAIPIGTKTKSLEIEGHKVGFEVMQGAAACYRVSDHLFMVQARNDERAALFLWDSGEKKVTDKMIDLNNVPNLWPVAPKRRLIQMHGKEAGYYGVNPSSKKFVKIGTTKVVPAGTTDLLGGNRDRLFFLTEPTKPRRWTHPGGFGETTLKIVESGKEAVEIKVELGDFFPIGSDAIRGNRLLLTKLKKENNNDTKTPPKYQVAYWDFEKESLKMLGEVEGTWVKSESGPPKGGWGPGRERPEPRWYPYLQIWWQLQNQEVNPVGNHSSYATSWVNPDTMEITKDEPKASRK